MPYSMSAYSIDALDNLIGMASGKHLCEKFVYH